MKAYFPMAILSAAVAVLLFLQLTSVGSAASDSAPALVRAQRIELVDERGVVRARLNTEADGEVVFRLISQQGEMRVKMGASNNGAGLVLANDQTEPGVHILATREGTSFKLKEGARERVLEP